MKWYSICSAHMSDFQEDCNMCNAGNWINENDPIEKADRELWNKDPDAWRAKHQNDILTFTDREGNEVFPFPNLK